MDTLPQLCTSCLAELIQAIEFRNKCRKSHRYLLEMLNNDNKKVSLLVENEMINQFKVESLEIELLVDPVGNNSINGKLFIYFIICIICILLSKRNYYY